MYETCTRYSPGSRHVLIWQQGKMVSEPIQKLNLFFLLSPYPQDPRPTLRAQKLLSLFF